MGAERREGGWEGGGRERLMCGPVTLVFGQLRRARDLGGANRKQQAWGRGLSPTVCLEERVVSSLPGGASQLSQMCSTWALSCCCPAGTCVEEIQESVHSRNQAQSIPGSALKHQINEGC